MMLCTQVILMSYDSLNWFQKILRLQPGCSQVVHLHKKTPGNATQAKAFKGRVATNEGKLNGKTWQYPPPTLSQSEFPG